MNNLVGQSLGRYQILEQLGEGGMATVYKAYDTRLERDVAVKVIRTDQFAPAVLERMLKRFEREGKALARLIHPNIVSVIDYGDHEGAPFLVMPYLKGGTLKQQLGKAMSWQEAVRLVLPVAQALEYAHGQNIVHRDVKPANILLTENNQPMLTDFGIAKILESEETMALTGTGVGLGTPEYMAPEQWTGEAGAQSDIYSLGVVLYELIAGRKPYVADTPAAVLLKQMNEPLPRPGLFIPDLPEAIEKVLLKALARRTEDRYPEMKQFVAALDRLISEGARTGEKPLEELFKATELITPSPVAAVEMQAQAGAAQGTAGMPTKTATQPEAASWQIHQTPVEKKGKKWVIWAIIGGVVAIFFICLLLGGGGLLNLASKGFFDPVNTAPVVVPTQTNILYRDDFSNPGSGWDNKEITGGSMTYSNGSYRIYVSEMYSDLVAMAGTSLAADVIIDVDITRAGGSENNDFGVMCRVQDIDNFYFFQISSDGYAVIGMFLNNEMRYLSAESMIKVDGIYPGTTTNHMRAECIGSNLALYANGNLVATVTDTTFGGGGDVGLMAGTFDEGGVDILFDNLIVSRP